jgi:hypothetical protein
LSRKKTGARRTLARKDVNEPFEEAFTAPFLPVSQRS